MMSPMVQSVSAIVRTAMHRYMLKMADIKESIILRMHTVKNAKEPTSQFYTYAEGILDNGERILIGGSGIDVPKDVHGDELSEADGAVERQHPLPDVL